MKDIAMKMEGNLGLNVLQLNITSCQLKDGEPDICKAGRGCQLLRTVKDLQVEGWTIPPHLFHLEDHVRLSGAEVDVPKDDPSEGGLRGLGGVHDGDVADGVGGLRGQLHLPGAGTCRAAILLTRLEW